jgi:shikimate dehydrogenase
MGIRGCCVTIPHKEDVIPFLDRITDRAEAVGAVNLLYWEGDELCGDNTDVPGFVAPLAELAPPVRGCRALVLGAGGASRAVVAGLKDLGCRVSVANRTGETARLLAEEFELEVVPWEKRGAIEAELVVNTTPLGMKGKFEDQTPFPASAFAGRGGTAYDIVYTPLRTRFLGKPRRRLAHGIRARHVHRSATASSRPGPESPCPRRRSTRCAGVGGGVRLFPLRGQEGGYLFGDRFPVLPSVSTENGAAAA